MGLSLSFGTDLGLRRERLEKARAWGNEASRAEVVTVHLPPESTTPRFLQRPPPRYPAFPLVLLFGFFLHWAVSMSQDFIRSSIHFLSQHLLSIYCVPPYFIHGAKVQAHSRVIPASWGWPNTPEFYIVSFFQFLNTAVFYSWSGLQPFLSIPLDGEEVMPFLFHFSGWCTWVRLDTAAGQVLDSLVVSSV